MHFIELLKRWHNNFPCTQKDLFFYCNVSSKKEKGQIRLHQIVAKLFEILHKYTCKLCRVKDKGEKITVHVYGNIYIYILCITINHRTKLIIHWMLIKKSTFTTNFRRLSWIANVKFSFLLIPLLTEGYFEL